MEIMDIGRPCLSHNACVDNLRWFLPKVSWPLEISRWWIFRPNFGDH